MKKSALSASSRPLQHSCAGYALISCCVPVFVRMAINMAGFIKRWVIPAIMYSTLYSISLFYGVLFSIRILYRWAKEKDAFWKVKNRDISPECLNDPAYGNHAYVQIKNVKLHYVEKGDKTKPLMIFLHGYPEFWYSWRHQIKEFSKDYWTVAVDMRGYGDSEKPVGIHYYRTKYLIEDVKNLIEALGREKCVLVGHDWGGFVLWSFLQIYPQYVNSYIIMNSPLPAAFRKMMIKNFSQFKKSWYMFFYQLPLLPELSMYMNDLAVFNSIFKSSKTPSPYTEQDVEAYKFTFGKPGALTFPINYYRANIIPDQELLKRRAEDVKPPRGLFLFGDQDKYIETEIVEITKRMVFNLTAEIIKGASHFVQQDDPKAVNKAMREFLKSGYEPEVVNTSKSKQPSED